jgi:peptidoglycan/xylan/chitin deacetylase (PgdA/CDA1 family)
VAARGTGSGPARLADVARHRQCRRRVSHQPWRLWPIGLVAICALVACTTPSRPTANAAGPTTAAPNSARPTVVSLTFDDAYEDQWLYAVPLLRAHHMAATFYVITADSDRPYRCCMSWAQLRTLQSQGDDIGSHTIDHPNLTRISASRITSEVCGSKQDMLINGIKEPVSFAYPFGAYDDTARRIVAQCGFNNARQGGGISPSNTTPSAPYRETLPPKDAFAVRTIAVDGASPIQLADLERFVTAAATKGGGWLPITFHDVCDSHATNYRHCMASYGPIQSTVLDRFLTWLQATGKRNGAPAGVVVRDVRQAIAMLP